MKKYIAILLSTVLMASCTSDYEQFNTNPNKLTYGSVGPLAMLENITVAGSNSLASYMLEWANDIAQVSGSAGSTVRLEHCYKLTQQYNTVWNRCYLQATNARHMEQLAAAQSDGNSQAIAITLRVYYLSIVTDLFGDVPYSQALRGAEGITRPIVDSQKEVYEGMLADLERANSLYDTAKPLSDTSKDKLFAGNTAKWQKFTNSLHLRLLNRVSGRNADFTPTVGERMAAIINNPTAYPVMESNDDNITVKFDGTATYYRNVFNQFDYSTDNSFSGDHHLSEVVLNMMLFSDTDQSQCDPRINIYGTPRYTSSHVWPWQGTKPGCTTEYTKLPSVYDPAYTNGDVETYLNYYTLCRDTNPNMLMCYDELLFIKAEAAMNGWIAGNAADYYNAAITASCKKWVPYGATAQQPVAEGDKVEFRAVTITDAQIAALLERPEVAWNNTAKRLAEQKWLALYWVVGFQQYSEMRRTGYPECVINDGIVKNRFSINAEGKSVFIARCEYPQTAVANNRANYEAALQRMGTSTNDIVTPVWWSGQAIAKDAGTPWPHSFRTLTYQE